MRRVHATVRGVVQGVNFRYATRQRARHFGVTGWVRNRPDGVVEIEIQGECESVDHMTAWLRLGPPTARDDHVELSEITPVEPERSFEIL